MATLVGSVVVVIGMICWMAPIFEKQAQMPHNSDLWDCVGISPDWERMRSILFNPRQNWVVLNDAQIVYTDGCTLLLMACRFPTVPPDIIAKLIAANPGALQQRGGLFQQVPLHMAAERGVSVEVLKSLWEADSSVGTLKNRTGQTPLDWARSNKHSDNVAFLEENHH